MSCVHQPAGEVEEWIESFRPQELERWEILSVFVDPRSPEWRRVTWRFQYRDPMRTLTSQEVDRVQMTLVEKLTSALASAQN